MNAAKNGKIRRCSRQGNGSKEARIVIGNYGEGELPRIAVNGKMKDALYLCNQQYWEISGAGYLQYSRGIYNGV